MEKTKKYIFSTQVPEIAFISIKSRGPNEVFTFIPPKLYEPDAKIYDFTYLLW